MSGFALTPSAARVLTDRVKADAAELWAKLLELYEGGAHTALGYSSWASYCSAEFDMGKSRSYQVLDAARVVEALPESTMVERPERPQSERVARELVPVLRDEGESAVVEVWREVQAEAELLGTTLSTTLVRNAARKRLARIKREQESERRRQQPAAQIVQFGDACEIRHGDVSSVLEDLTGTVDAIITDPPYAAEFVDLYGELGALAVRLLRPGGTLAVLTGTPPALLSAVEDQIGAHLQLRWRCVYLDPGQRFRFHPARVSTGWKPVLLYSRPGAEPRSLTDDVFTSAASHQDTRFHEWGQTESGFTQLVERLTDFGQLVVDPFLGGGTTAVVCRTLGRRFVGCDIDAGAVAAARDRLAARDLEAAA